MMLFMSMQIKTLFDILLLAEPYTDIPLKELYSNVQFDIILFSENTR